MKTMLKMLLSLTLALVLLTGAALAEEEMGNVPSRGLTLPFTQADAENGLVLETRMASTADGLNVPTLQITYLTPEGVDALKAIEDAIAREDEAAYEAAAEKYQNNKYLLDVVYLIESSYDYTQLDGFEDATTNLGENDGYIYFHERLPQAANVPEHQAGLEAAKVRTAELVAGITFQPVVLEEGEITVVPNAFPAFTTQDLNGNTVTNEIFLGKTLTVVNIWGTFCTPCINEMPELAEWAASMPEGVQLIGLVCDLNSPDQADVLETAQMICEATGVKYTNLIASADFAEFLTGIVGVPTTIFVDGNGAIVGDPIVGAYVPAYKAFVEEYLNAQ